MAKDRPPIQSVINSINKKFGAGTITKASEASALNISRIPLESISLTAELGGGLPENRIILLVGHYSTAKTFLAYKMAKAILDKYWDDEEKVVLWVDAEGAHTNEWANTLMGSDKYLERMLVVQPDTAEQALDITDNVVRSGSCVGVFVDSVEALVPTVEVESSYEDQQMGIKARLMNKFYRKILNANRIEDLTDDTSAKCTLVMINQLRQSIGYMSGDVIPGGKGQEFAASVILEVRRGEWIKEKQEGQEVIIGQLVKFKTKKNKTFAPFRQGEFFIYTKDSKQGEWKAGDIDTITELVSYGVYYGFIQKTGAWFFLDGDEENKFHGGEKLVEYLKENKEIQAKLRADIIDVIIK